jgi:hypothetical protein
MWKTIFKNTKEGGGSKGSMPPIFFYLRIIFLAAELKGGHITELGKSGEEGCVCVY